MLVNETHRLHEATVRYGTPNARLRVLLNCTKILFDRRL